MKLLCISGFLGSGKTTILLQVAVALAGAGQTAAIVVNEIGEVGVDGGELGLPVRELFGGCVCCTLQAGLVQALHDIAREVAPHWVIVEPAGLASPSDLVEAVRCWAPEVDHTLVLAVVDAARFGVLSEVAAPLIGAQIQAASVVAVNKIDQVDDATLADVEAGVRAVNPSAVVVPVCAARRDGALALLKTLCA